MQVLLALLFPKNLDSRFKELIASSVALSECADKLTGLITKKAERQCDKFRALHYLGFDTTIPQASLNQDVMYETIVFYKAAEAIKGENPELIDEIKRLLDFITKTKKEVLTELEYFLKCNNLRLKQKT